jgi:hypothetical protein
MTEGITPAGWTVMIVSVGSVVTLVTFCLYRVLILPPVDVEEHLHGPLEIDTRDTLDAD